MPIYVYKCTKCEHKETMQRSISDRDKDLSCPVCGGEMKREVARSSFVLSGGGWYKDGYK